MKSIIVKIYHEINGWTDIYFCKGVQYKTKGKRNYLVLHCCDGQKREIFLADKESRDFGVEYYIIDSELQQCFDRLQFAVFMKGDRTIGEKN